MSRDLLSPSRSQQGQVELALAFRRLTDDLLLKLVVVPSSKTPNIIALVNILLMGLITLFTLR